MPKRKPRKPSQSERQRLTNTGRIDIKTQRQIQGR